MSWIVPISLLANITEIRMVLSVIALRISSTSMSPSGWTGTAVTVSEEEMSAAQLELGRLEGIYAAPEGAATYAGLRKLTARGFIEPHHLVVLFQTGMGIKYDPPTG